MKRKGACMGDNWWEDEELVRHLITLVGRIVCFIVLAVVIEWWQMSEHMSIRQIGGVIKSFFIK